jgi:translocation and assembly module TamA
MEARGKRGVVARLSCAAASLAFISVPAFSQTPDPAELDPAAPLAPMPDLGVEWPDMNAPDAPPPADAGTPAISRPPEIDASEERKYSVVIEGLQAVDEEPAIAKAFDEQSALREGRGEAANAAQIDRRSRADADLLAELLRSRGYYDASVEPRIEANPQMLQVVLAVEAGRQYRFQAVELPGLDAAGPEAAALRKVFAIQPGDPVIAEDVIKAGTDLQVALGEEGFASAEVGEQQIEVDHQTFTASLVLPVQPGPVARFGRFTVSGSPPFSAKHVATIARFDPGDPFRRSKVNDLRRALIATGLVASAEVRVVPSPDRQTVDVDVHLEQAR